MDFAAALAALKAGGKVARTSWNHPDMYVELEDANDNHSNPQFNMVVGGEKSKWEPTHEDILAEDWEDGH